MQIEVYFYPANTILSIKYLKNPVWVHERLSKSYIQISPSNTKQIQLIFKITAITKDARINRQVCSEGTIKLDIKVNHVLTQHLNIWILLSLEHLHLIRTNMYFNLIHKACVIAVQQTFTVIIDLLISLGMSMFVTFKKVFPVCDQIIQPWTDLFKILEYFK